MFSLQVFRTPYASFFHVGVAGDMPRRKLPAFHKKDFHSEQQDCDEQQADWKKYEFHGAPIDFCAANIGKLMRILRISEKYLYLSELN